jgi:hypothetical protein
MALSERDGASLGVAEVNGTGAIGDISRLPEKR